MGECISSLDEDYMDYVKSFKGRVWELAKRAVKEDNAEIFGLCARLYATYDLGEVAESTYLEFNAITERYNSLAGDAFWHMLSKREWLAKFKEWALDIARKVNDKFFGDLYTAANYVVVSAQSDKEMDDNEYRQTKFLAVLLRQALEASECIENFLMVDQSDLVLYPADEVTRNKGLVCMGSAPADFRP